jgi:hypothetical protein
VATRDRVALGTTATLATLPVLVLDELIAPVHDRRSFTTEAGDASLRLLMGADDSCALATLVVAIAPRAKVVAHPLETHTCQFSCCTAIGAREWRMLIALLVSGLVIVGGVFLPYRSGYSGLGYVDGTDDARIFFGVYTLLLGFSIVVLAIVGLAGSNPRDEPKGLRLMAAAGLVGLIAMCLTIADVSAALDSNDAFGGSLGLGIVMVMVGAAAASAIGAIAVESLSRSRSSKR